MYLARGLNLSQRYYLHRASQAPQSSLREEQLGELQSISCLFKMQYRVVGQAPAIKTIKGKILDRIAANVDDPEPLVMVFAGPPGHGKTELAEQLGGLLNLKHVVVPCSQMRSEMALLGSTAGYERSREGTSLNNHLSENDGLTSVAFLDEFDKTSKDVSASLLTIFSEGNYELVILCRFLANMFTGTYEDRRTNRPVDCRRTIWLLASNMGDEAIAKFYERELKEKTDEDKVTADLTPLTEELKDLFKGRFSVGSRSDI